MRLSFLTSPHALWPTESLRSSFCVCACVRASVRCGHLYRLLRPELVKQNQVPLSSDAFSRWGLHHAAQHNSEVHASCRKRVHMSTTTRALVLIDRVQVVRAVSKLTGDIIPTFASLLRDSLAATPSAGRVALFDFWPVNVGTHMDGELLTQQMHRRGINMRYLSAIYTALTTSPSGESSFHKLRNRVTHSRRSPDRRRCCNRAGGYGDGGARSQDHPPHSPQGSGNRGSVQLLCVVC
jgi:hypothetical protein